MKSLAPFHLCGLLAAKRTAFTDLIRAVRTAPRPATLLTGRPQPHGSAPFFDRPVEGADGWSPKRSFPRPRPRPVNAQPFECSVGE